MATVIALLRFVFVGRRRLQSGSNEGSGKGEDTGVLMATVSPTNGTHLFEKRGSPRMRVAFLPVFGCFFGDQRDSATKTLTHVAVATAAFELDVSPRTDP